MEELTREQAKALVSALIAYELPTYCLGIDGASPTVDLSPLLTVPPRDFLARAYALGRVPEDIDRDIAAEPIQTTEDNLREMMEAIDYWLEADTVSECVNRELEGEPNPWYSELDGVDIRWVLDTLEPLIRQHVTSEDLRERYHAL